jgi:DNA polymerase III beta subunit
MEANAPGVPKAPLPYELQKPDEQAETNRAGGSTFQNPRTGRIYPRQQPGSESGPLSALDLPIQAPGHAAEAVEALATPAEDAAMQIAAGVPPAQVALSPESLKAGARGVAKGIQAGLEAATPLLAGGAAAAPLETAATLASAAFAQAKTEDLLKQVGVAPEYSELAGSVAGLLAGYAAGKIRLSPEQASLIETLQGKDAQTPEGQAARVHKLQAMASDPGASQGERDVASALLKRNHGIEFEPFRPAEAPAAPESAASTPATAETPQAAPETPAAQPEANAAPAETNVPGFETREILPEDVKPGAILRDANGRTGVVTELRQGKNVKWTDDTGAERTTTLPKFLQRMTAIAQTPAASAQPEAPVSPPVGTAPPTEQNQQPAAPQVQETPTLGANLPPEQMPGPAVTQAGAENTEHVEKEVQAAEAVAPPATAVEAPATPVVAAPPPELPHTVEALPPNEEPKEAEAPYKFSSAQVNLPTAYHRAFTDAVAGIPDSELAEDGREDDPHITALYGIHSTSAEPVKKLLKDQGPITATIGPISIFKGEDGKPDVVKLDIDSPALHDLNGKLRTLEHTNNVPDYTPHLTLAYLKPGEGAKYVGKVVPGLTGQQVTFNRLMFSGKDQARTDIPLAGQTKPERPRAIEESAPEAPSGEFGKSSLSRLSDKEIRAAAAKDGIDPEPYLAERAGPGGNRTGRNKLEHAIFEAGEARKAKGVIQPNAEAPAAAPVEAAPGKTKAEQIAANEARIRELESKLGASGTVPATKPNPTTTKTVQQLRGIADTLDKQIEAKRNPAIAQQNPTRRRADIAAGMAKEADAMELVQSTLRNLADAHENGSIPSVLTNVKTRPLLEDLLSRDKFPQAWLHSATVTHITTALKGKPNTKEAVDLLTRRNGGDGVRLTGMKEITLVRDLLDKADAAGIGPAKYAKEELARATRAYGAGLTPENWLQAHQALKPYATTKSVIPPKERQIAELERGLIGRKIEGFFPTPKALADRMVEEADIKPGMRVLEPSAGNGRLADAIAKKTDELTAIEPVSDLRAILDLKGHAVSEDRDFLAHRGEYDRVVMNPPFENGQDMDHVRHAFDLLKPGGKLVAIMGEGGFFRGDKKATAFREWLQAHGGTSEKLPEGTFKESGTGVATRLVTVTKAAATKEAPAIARAPAETPKPKTAPLPEADYAEVETKLANSEADLRAARQNYERLDDLFRVVKDATERELSGIDLQEFSRVKNLDEVEEDVRKQLILAGRKYEAAMTAHDQALNAAAAVNPLLTPQAKPIGPGVPVPEAKEANSSLGGTIDEVSDQIKLMARRGADDAEYDPRDDVPDLKSSLKFLDEDIRDLEHADPALMATAKETAATARKVIESAESYTVPPPKPEPSADRYRELDAQVKAMHKNPAYAEDTPEGRRLRNQALELSDEKEIHRPAFVEEVNAESIAKAKAEPKGLPAPAQRAVDELKDLEADAQKLRSTDFSKIDAKDPVAKEVSEDALKTAKLKVDMRKLPGSAPNAPERVGEFDAYPKTGTVTIPAATAKQIVPPLKKVIEAKSTIPILKNVSVISQKGKTKITATDLEQAVTFTIPTKAPNSAVTIPVSALDQAMKAKNKGDLKIDFQPGTVPSQNGKASLSVGPAESSAATLDISNYPEIPTATEKVGKIPAEKLLDAIKKTFYAISAEESRFTLNGALLEVKGGKANMVATDGHRLSAQSFDVPGIEGDHRFLLPRRTLDTMTKLYAKHAGDLTVNAGTGASKKFLTFDTPDGTTSLYTMQLDGNFPDYQRVLPNPRNYTHTATVDREELLDLMKRIIAMKERSNNVLLSFRPDQVIGFKSADGAEVRGSAPATLKTLPVPKPEKDEVQQNTERRPNPRENFNAKYIADAIAPLEGKNVEINLQDSSTARNMGAMTIRDPQDPNHTAIIMPMRDDVGNWDDGLPPVNPVKEEGKKLGPEAGTAPALSDVIAHAATRIDQVRDFFDDKGASADRLTRNLNFVSRISPELDTAALKASGWKGLAAAIMYTTTPAMDKALEGSMSHATVEEVFKILQEGRLRGIRTGLWLRNAAEVADATDEEIVNAFPGYSRLLDAVQGRQGLPGDLSQAAAARLERNEIDELRDFLIDTFDTTADLVAHVMLPGRFNEMLSDPSVRRAIDIYKQNAEPAMRDLHEEHEGILSQHLGPVMGGTYFPLIPLADEEQHPGGPGIKTPYIKPRNANKLATGLSSDYDPTLKTFRSTLERRVHASVKFDLLRAAEATGWLTPVGADDDPRVFVDPNGNEWPAAVREMAPGKTLIRPGQKPIPVGKRFGVMPKVLANELDIILEGPNYDEAPNALNGILHLLNRSALAGAAVMESVFHGKNLAGGIVQNMPAVLATLGKGGYAGFLKDSNGIAAVLNAAPSPTEFAADLIKMGRLGILGDRFGQSSYSKRMSELLGEDGSLAHRISLAPLLFGPQGLDVLARWMLFKAKETLDPGYTPREMVDFVNQLGIYVNGQQSRMVRFLRAQGLNPFAVAGVAGLGRGLRSLTGGVSPVAGSLGWKLANWLTIGIGGSLLMWYLTHKAVTGKSPLGDPTAKPGKIPLPSKFRRSTFAQALAPGGGTLYLDMQYGNPDVARGLRATGLDAAFRTANAGGSTQQTAEAALAQMLDSWSTPLTGPATRAMIAGLGGVEPHVNSLIDSHGKNAVSLLGSLPEKQTPFTTFGQKLTGLPANAGWRTRAAVMELNQMFGIGLEDIGVMPKLPQATGQQPETLPRGAVDILLPSLVSGPSNPYGAAAHVRQQRAAMGQ